MVNYSLDIQFCFFGASHEGKIWLNWINVEVKVLCTIHPLNLCSLINTLIY